MNTYRQWHRWHFYVTLHNVQWNTGDANNNGLLKPVLQASAQRVFLQVVHRQLYLLPWTVQRGSEVMVLRKKNNWPNKCTKFETMSVFEKHCDLEITPQTSLKVKVGCNFDIFVLCPTCGAPRVEPPPQYRPQSRLSYLHHWWNESLFRCRDLELSLCIGHAASEVIGKSEFPKLIPCKSIYK